MKSKLSIIITDIILIVGLVLCLLSDKNINPDATWQSSHCMISTVWFVLIALHVWQHWKLVKAFRLSRVRLKNRPTTLTIAVFIGMFFSITALIVTTSPGVIYFHNVYAHIFMVVVIVHLIARSKRLYTMIKSNK